ncbi:MAG TPA: SCO family protein [Myxococcota bacterium]|nr:SCO family protein [Myxococcota bacterium]
MRRLGLALLSLALCAGCGVQREETYKATGFVQSVDVPNKQVTISHEEIQGFMPAMTMNFDVARPGLLEGVAPGARVEFDLHRSATMLRIEALRVVAPALSDSAPAPALAEQDVAPDFELVDQDGQRVRLSDWRGRAVLVDFVFTRCPGPCPIQTARLVDVQRRLPRELAGRTHFASITLDPAYDTGARLREYADAHRAQLGNWSFLTGDPAQVQSVLDAYRIGTIRQPDGSLDHMVATFLIGPDGRIAHRYLGLEGAASAMLDDLAKVLS